MKHLLNGVAIAAALAIAAPAWAQAPMTPGGAGAPSAAAPAAPAAPLVARTSARLIRSRVDHPSFTPSPAFPLVSRRSIHVY